MKRTIKMIHRTNKITVRKIHTHETIQHKTIPRETERRADRSEKEEGENNTRRDERSNQEDKEQGGTVEQQRGNEINQEEQPIRKTLLGKIGLVEYNPNKKIWECRIDDCEAGIDTTTKISPRRKNITPNTTLGPMPKN